MNDDDGRDDEVAKWATASESLRSVVKWIAASFGALGALLIGTAPLGGLGRLHTVNAWLVAVAFGTVALGGVGVIVWRATTLLTPATITLADVDRQPEFESLRELVKADPTAYLGLWGSDIGSFVENRNTEFRALSNVDNAIASSPHADPRLQALQDARPMLLKSVEACGRVSSRLLAVAGFYDLSQRFARAKRWMFGAATVVVIGVVGFVASMPGKDATGADSHTAAPALVSLTPKGVGEVGPGLGSACPAPFKAVLLSGGVEGPWQLMITDPKCTNGTVALSREQATVIGVFPSP